VLVFSPGVSDPRQLLSMVIFGIVNIMSILVLSLGVSNLRQLLSIVSVGIVNIMNMCLDERTGIESGVSNPRKLFFVFSWNYFSLQNNDGS